MNLFNRGAREEALTSSHTSTHHTGGAWATRPGPSRRFLRARHQMWAYRLEEGWKRAQEWVSETVTVGGWFLVGVAAFGLLLGALFAWPEAAGAGLAALTLLVFAALFLLGGRTLQAEVALEVERVVVGTPVHCQVSVANGGKRVTLPFVLSVPVGPSVIEVPIPFLRGHADFHADLQVPTQRRSILRVGPLMSTRSSPVGIFVRETSWPGSHTLYVYPKTTALPPTTAGLIRDLEGEPHARLVPDDLSFHAIREYAPGDPQAHIHWKSTAKTGRLMVRQFEETVRSEMVVALSTRAGEFADEDEFELAVSAAGSFGLRGLEDGRGLRFVVAAPRPQFMLASFRRVSVLSTTSRAALLDDLAGIEETDNANPLIEVSEVAAEDATLVSVAVIVTGSRVPLTELRRSALAFGPGIATIAVVCDPRARPSVQHLGGLTVVTVALLDDLRSLMIRRAQR